MIIQKPKHTTRQKWLFYVACAPKYGGGHMARSIELAKEVSRNAEVVFVLEDLSVYWIEKLQSLNLRYLPVDEADLTVFYDGVWVDHYEPDDGFLSSLKRCSKRSCALIDTISQRVDFDLCVTYADIIDGKQVICGFEYALINSEYKSAENKKAKNWDCVISFGQVDSKCATLQVLKALEAYDKKIAIAVVVGKLNAHMPEIEKNAQDMNLDITLINNASSLVDILPQATTYIGSGGVSMLEACASGLACMVVTTADNQKAQAKALSDKGAINWIGDIEDINETEIISTLNMMMDPEYREKVLACCKTLVDAKGSMRLAHYLLSLGNEDA